jgi:NAD(P)-dependent dehydrogenase (short-subunit alcohol dehydrogenase family)
MPTILITGANRGIGLEFVRQYSLAGWKVLATARNPQRPTDLATLAAAHKNITLHELDITRENSILDLSTQLNGKPIDLLIHNSGIYPRKGTRIGGLDYHAWRDTIETNLFGAMKVTEGLLPNVAASHRKQIAAISSTMGSISATSHESIQGSGAAYQYRTSKAALNMAMAVLAQELAPRGFSVVILCPGWVKTDMGGPAAAITTEQSVSGMRKILEKPASEISGKFFSYDGAPRPW